MFSLFGSAIALAEAGDSANDPRSLNSGDVAVQWEGNTIWFASNIPANRILVSTPSEGTVRAEVYESLEDVASESSVSKTFSATTPLTWENPTDAQTTIYLKVTTVLDAAEIVFHNYFDYVVAPVNTTWEAAIELTEGDAVIDDLSYDNIPLWYKVVVPAGKAMTAQKNYPHFCLVYAGDANAEAQANVSGAFAMGSTLYTYSNTSGEAENLYFCFKSTSGPAPHTMTISFEDATPAQGSAWNCAYPLEEGANNIQIVSDGQPPIWYACEVPARNNITITNNYWPITVYFYTSDAEAEAGAQEGDGNFNSNATWSFDNKSTSAKTIYMKAVYTQGFAQYANVSVAFTALGEDVPGEEEPGEEEGETADAVVGEYIGTYALVSIDSSNDFFAGKSGEMADRTLKVEKASAGTVNITTPQVSAMDGIPVYSLTIKGVKVDEAGYISGGNFTATQIGPWGDANAITISGQLDGTNADIAFVVDANIMGAASTINLTFKTENAPTHIQRIDAAQQHCIYNLQGMRSNGKGLVIVNGQKMLVK